MSRARARRARAARVAARSGKRGGSLTARFAVIATLLSAGLYACAFPPLSVRPLAWIALVPFLLAIRDRSVGGRLGLGLLWTLAVGWGLGTWMPSAVADFFRQPLAVGVALFLVVTAGMAAPYYVAFAGAYAPLVRCMPAAGPFVAAAAWAAAELARGRLLNGTLVYVGNSPWGTFGYSQVGVDSVVQLASITGVYGISFVLVCVNAALAEAIGAFVHTRSRVPRTAIGLAAALALVSGVVGFGAAALGSADGERPARRPVPIAVAQANLGAAARWGEEGGARTVHAYALLTAEAFTRRDPVTVFWPEAAITSFIEQDPAYRLALAFAIHGRDVELVVGAPRALGADGAGPYTNSVYVVGLGGELGARYDKQYLLPFMEYFPLRIELARRRFGRIREFTPGAPTAPLPTRVGKAGVLICNEAFLPHVAARRMAEGADFLFNPSNDSWVPDAGFARQQLDIVALRAVEQRTHLIRASDSGPSAVVDPFGRILEQTTPLARAVLLTDFAPTPAGSVYAAVGDLFGGACLVISALALTWCAIRAKRSPSRRSGSGT